jgi:hypothetical protein
MAAPYFGIMGFIYGWSGLERYKLPDIRSNPFFSFVRSRLRRNLTYASNGLNVPNALNELNQSNQWNQFDQLPTNRQKQVILPLAIAIFKAFLPQVRPGSQLVPV